MLLTDCDQREIISNKKMNSEKVKYKKKTELDFLRIQLEFL